MGLSNLQYHRPDSVEHALALAERLPQARFFAGGTDLLPQGRCGQGDVSVVIDLKGIPGLAEIRQLADGALAIGATATVNQVASHPLIATHYPVLVECCLSLGSYPLRNRATVAGNICNGSPCADTAAALLALDAVLVAQATAGSREIPIRNFFQGPGQTACRADELITEIVLPAATAGGRGHYGRLARRRAVDISTVAVLVTVLERCRPRHRVSLLSVAPTPLRVEEAEAILDQQGPSGAEQAAAAAQRACRPIDDLRGSAAYRQAMVGVLLIQGVRALSNGGRR